jgi:MSHA pilin protein MshB
VTSVDKRKCKDVLDLILELPPTNTTSNIDAEIADFEFVVREDASSKSALCVYYSVASIGLPENSTPANGIPDGERFDGFTYNPATGQVSVF